MMRAAAGSILILPSLAAYGQTLTGNLPSKSHPSSLVHRPNPAPRQMGMRGGRGSRDPAATNC
jgi:hypothetical protein